jgi:dolichyl-phosphate beta-glucosyltransferase
MHIAPDKLPSMISIVIPAFNEECTREATLFAISSVIAKLSPMEWEVLIVDDGSQDRTYQVGQKLTLNPHIRLYRHESNRGKGAAVRTGVLHTHGDAVLIMDADLSTHPGMLELFIPVLAGGADLVTGDRRNPETRIERPQTLQRRIMGGVYAAMARLVAGSSLRDFNCGFKLMRGDVARSLLAQCHSDRWVWDVEVIALALRQGLEVTAIPVTWRQGDRTSVDPFRASLTSFIELAKLWIHLRRKDTLGL